MELQSHVIILTFWGHSQTISHSAILNFLERSDFILTSTAYLSFPITVFFRTEVKLYLFVVLIYIHLMVSNAEQIFMCSMCFPRHIGREVYWKWNNQNSNQCLLWDAGIVGCSFIHCTTVSVPALHLLKVS